MIKFYNKLKKIFKKQDNLVVLPQNRRKKFTKEKK